VKFDLLNVLKEITYYIGIKYLFVHRNHPVHIL